MTAAALESLAEERARYVAFVQKHTGSRAVAEDIVQQAFVKSLERGGEIRREESTVAWFYRMLRNAVIDHFRRSDASERALESWAHELERFESPSAETEAEICRCIVAGLHQLKPEYRQALEISDMESRPLADLALEAGISESNAAVRVHRARTALRKRIRDCCASCADCTCES